MKRTIWIFLAILSTVLIFGSCRKAMVEPLDLYTLDNAFDKTDSNAVLAQRFLYSAYTYLPSGFNRVGGDMLDAASGDAVSSVISSNISWYNNGTISVTNNPDAYFSNSYNGIRQINIFLANVDLVPVPAANPTRTITWKAEARFIRAFLYWELVKRYGGVPLVGDKIFSVDDNLQLKRNTYADCVNYIVSECDAIKGQLTKEPINSTDLGRIPRGAAIALKCRLYLYGASPLFNGGGIPGDPNPELTGYPTADPSRWNNVIAAAEELIGLNAYSFPSGTGTTAYSNVFSVKMNSEIILAKQSSNDFGLETTNAPVGYAVNNSQSLGRTSPTQDFVDAFTMNNGLPITDPASGYKSTTPYVNRDPRLTASVFYNGSMWLNRPVQTFEGGLDKPNNTTGQQTRTGYYLRKFLYDNSTSTAYSSQSHNFVYFRYAEVLLNYAEALNEVGKIENAVSQIILIRQRAGILPGTNSRYGIPVGISQSAMRTLIQNERRIELSFEEHRFWDVRRWKIANTELNKTLSGMIITKDPVTPTFTYKIVPVTNIVFQDKLYRMPLPYNETVTDANLQQNYGW